MVRVSSVSGDFFQDHSNDSGRIAGFVLRGVYNILHVILSTSHGVVLGRRFARVVPKITFEEMVHEMMEYEYRTFDNHE